MLLSTYFNQKTPTIAKNKLVPDDFEKNIELHFKKNRPASKAKSQTKTYLKSFLDMVSGIDVLDWKEVFLDAKTMKLEFWWILKN